MQAITTTYRVSQRTGRRSICAKCPGGLSVRIPRDTEFDVEVQHEQAASELARKLGWLDTHDLVSGTTGPDTQVHVLVPKKGG